MCLCIFLSDHNVFFFMLNICSLFMSIDSINRLWGFAITYLPSVSSIRPLFWNPVSMQAHWPQFSDLNETWNRWSSKVVYNSLLYLVLQLFASLVGLTILPRNFPSVTIKNLYGSLPYHTKAFTISMHVIWFTEKPLRKIWFFC